MHETKHHNVGTVKDDALGSLDIVFLNSRWYAIRITFQRTCKSTSSIVNDF